MPYELHVVRTANWMDAAHKPVTKDDVDWLIRSDAELEWSRSDFVEMEDGETTTRYYLICWRGAPCFLWFRDQITCATPNEEQTRKLIEIAGQLDGRVFGDDDEEYVLSRGLLGGQGVRVIGQ